MSDIFDEVNTELKNERIVNLVKKYGFHIISLVAIIVIVVAGFVIWEKTIESKGQMLGALYYNMQNLDKNANDEKTLMESLNHLIDSKDKAYEVLAAFKKVGILKAQNKYQDTISIYDNLSANHKIDIAFRELSDLMAADIIIANNLADLDIENRLAKLTQKNHNYYDSGILLKGIYLKNNNKSQELKTMFDGLDDNISPHIKEKLDILMEDNNDQ
jgi:hypothetical protein